MLDDLRNAVRETYEEEKLQEQRRLEEKRLRAARPFLGLTAAQRFILAFTLFLILLVLAAFLLILFGKVTP